MSNPSARLVSPPWVMLAFVLMASAFVPNDATAQVHPDTKPLTWDADIASRMVADADRFLLRKLDASIAARKKRWQRSFDSADAYNRSLKPNRERLRAMLGLVDPRTPAQPPRLLATVDQPALVGEAERFRVYAVRWPTVRNLFGEGLLLEPKQFNGVAVVALPDADQTPEMISGLQEGVKPELQFARRLAASGCRVIVPTLISRDRAPRIGGANLTNREFIYRSAYELGRHLIGYELQQVFAAADWLRTDPRRAATTMAVAGYGEGGMLALYAGALDTNIDVTVVSGYFDSRQTIWEQPVDRNVFGLLTEFGDAELATMVAPRTLIIDASRGPELALPGEGGAPAILRSPTPQAAQTELLRARSLIGAFASAAFQFVAGDPPASGLRPAALERLFTRTEGERKLEPLDDDPQPTKAREITDNHVKDRQRRLLEAMDQHNQWLLSESPYERADFMKHLDFSSLEAYQASVERYRKIFRDEIVGAYDFPLADFNARSRKLKETDKYISYEVVLDVTEDIFAYGILIRPKNIAEGERRPVVVCQHGLEGRPQDIVDGDHRAYHDFAAKLAERGFVTFSPQNLYIFRDRFRTLQRKSYPLRKTLFSIIVPQHQQIVNWLSDQPYVDPERIAFYGLSYGGKSAMRIPPLVDNYCLSICSADFNDWVWKNASSRARYSYVRTGEYEIFEFNLGRTFNYSEMAALIAPRPFMVERGHFDGVAPDERVALEFAKVRHLYQAKLGIGDRCEIEWFVGPHTINGKGSSRSDAK